jgi:transposase
MSDKVSYRLAVTPRRLEVLVYVRPVYAVEQDDGSTLTVTPEMPGEMIPRGRFAPSGLAHIIAEHFAWHTPWHRLAQKFSGDGFRLPKSTCSGAALRAAPLAIDLVKVMEAHSKLVAPSVHIDPTSVRFLQKERCHKGAAWIRVVDRLSVFVNFTRQQNGKEAHALLTGWGCPVVADGASIFDLAERVEGFDRGGCWAHARRGLVYASPMDSRALVGVKLCNDLFAIERELAGLSPEERLAARQVRSQPIVHELFRWRDELLADPSLKGHSELAKALRYFKTQEQRLLLFLRDGRVSIHNNSAELGARHVAVGRKSWLFLGSDQAAEAAGTWLSLILSARLHELAPEPYLRDLFRVLPEWPSKRLLELAPHNWRDTRARLDPTQLAAELGPLRIPPLVSQQ